MIAQDSPSSTPTEVVGPLPNVTVWNPEIDRLCATVGRWVRMDLPGGSWPTPRGGSRLTAGCSRAQTPCCP